VKPSQLTVSAASGDRYPEGQMSTSRYDLAEPLAALSRTGPTNTPSTQRRTQLMTESSSTSSTPLADADAKPVTRTAFVTGGSQASAVLRPSRLPPRVPGYAGSVASKHAEIGLTKSAALDYADRGVRVNAVCRGLVTTPLIADMVTEKPEIHEPTRRLPSAWPHRRAGGGRRLDRLPGHRHVQLRHRRRTARVRRLSGALIAPPRTPESIKEKT